MLKNNIKLALRSLVKNRSFTVLNIIGLTIGMAGATLIFLLLNYELQTDANVRNKDRVYRVITHFGQGDDAMSTSAVAHPVGDALRTDFGAFEKVAMIDQTGGILSVADSKQKVQRLFNSEGRIAFVQPSILNILDYHALSGDTKSALSSPNTAVLTKSMAVKLFRTKMAVGKVFNLEHKLLLTVGAVIEDYFPNTNFPFDILISYVTHLRYEQGGLNDWSNCGTQTSCLVKLKSGAEAKAVVVSFPQFIKRHFPEKGGPPSALILQPLNEIKFNGNYGNYPGNIFSSTLLNTFAAIAMVLLLTSCINFINLSTAISGTRSREVGVKKVLGSLSGQLFWQFMTESSLLILISLTLAIAVSAACVPLLKALFGAEVGVKALVDPAFILYIASLFVIMVFLSGFYPGRILSLYQPVKALKGKIDGGKKRGLTLRKVLVVFQFCISQVLIFGTIIMISQLNFVRNANLGLKKDAIYLMKIPVNTPRLMSLFRSRVQNTKSVNSLSFSSNAPLSGEVISLGFNYNGSHSDEKFGINALFGDSAYLKTYDLKLIAGHNIRGSDTIDSYLVNQAWLRRMGIKNPEQVLGHVLNVDKVPAQIVGVVRDFHTSSLKSEIPPIFIASNQKAVHTLGIQIDPGKIIEARAALDKVWKEVYPDYILDSGFFDEKIAKMYEADENLSRMVNGFAFLAIIIGCLGLFGLVSFTALQKTKEIGIRKVLGASATEIMVSFMKDFGFLILVAFVISAPLGAVIMKMWLQNFQFKINLGPWVFLVALSISCLITLLTIGFKIVEAAGANPVKSLRAD